MRDVLHILALDRAVMEVAVYVAENTDDERVVVTEFDGNTLVLNANEARTLAEALNVTADLLESGSTTVH